MKQNELSYGDEVRIDPATGSRPPSPYTTPSTLIRLFAGVGFLVFGFALEKLDFYSSDGARLTSLLAPVRRLLLLLSILLSASIFPLFFLPPAPCETNRPGPLPPSTLELQSSWARFATGLATAFVLISSFLLYRRIPPYTY